MPSLTPRQCEVMDLLVLGLTNKAIARSLGISTQTVKCQCSDIYRRLDVDSRVSAAMAWTALKDESPPPSDP